MIKKILKFNYMLEKIIFMSVIILTMLVSCKKHKHDYKLSVVEATCTEQGYTLHTCSCGESYKDNYTEKVDHHYQNGSCIYCGKEEPHTHSYTTSVVPPSCTEEGYTLHTCSCGESYKDNYTDKVPHTYQDGFCIHCGEREIIEYDVTFVLNYQGTTSEVHTTEQGMITFIPTREGYVFNGWWISEGSIGDEYILSKQYDMTELVTQSGLILYAEWVEKPTEAHQLPAPNVSINQELFSWKAVPNAQNYTIQIYQNGSSQIYFQETVEDTNFLFDASFPAGYYRVSIRANGDGIHTVNSVYVFKYYAHRVLSSVSRIELDMTTSILNWTPVQNATSYELYINGQMIDTLMVTQYDLSSYEAGTYTIKIVALADGYQSSIANQNVIKRRLLAPEVEVQLDDQTISYTLSWKDVVLANQYILNINGEEIKISDTTYRIDMTSPYWKNETMEISIQSFDTNADYLISSSSQTIELTKKYTLEVNQNLEEAGKVSVSKEGLYQVGDPITLEAITNKGYIFDGWYDGENLLSKDEVYSFSVSHQNMIYTAKWTYYTITTQQNAYGGGYITPFNEKITEVGESITLNATLYLGYVWDGWYDGETLLTTDFTYTFDMPNRSVTYIAKYTLQEDMNNFIFTSSETECTIIGVVDRNIEEITIPDYVTNIRKGAFQNCDKLVQITLPFVGETLNGNANTHFGYIFGAGTYQVQQEYIPTSLKKVTIINGMSIKTGTFYQCSQLTTIALPEQINSIEDSAFYQCNSLENFIIPSQVSTIGDSAFYQCSNLLQIELPNSVTTLGDSAFYNCYRLAEITLSNQLNQIEENTFYGCSNLNYKEDEYGKYLGNQENPYLALIYLKGQEMTNIVVSKDAKLIRKGTFKYSNLLTSLTLPFVGATYSGTTNTHFGYIFGASSYHENNQFIPSTLQEVTITSGECIPALSFIGCSNLTHIAMTGDMITIGVSAMSGCKNLTTLTLPNTIQKIEGSAFDNTNIQHLYYLGTIEEWCNITIQSSPFYDIYSTSVQDIQPLNHFYQLDENCQWKEITSIEIPTSITEIGSNQFNGFHFVTNIVIPTTVKRINANAFANCIGVNELVIPNSVIEFGSYLSDFSGCLYKCINLKKLTLPFIGETLDKAYESGLAGLFDRQSVPTSLQEVIVTQGTAIPEGAFRNCNSLKRIVIPNTITVIEDSAFSGCNQLMNMLLPTGLIQIGENAFSGCGSLTQLHIPQTVQEIGYAALSGCTSLNNLILPFIGDGIDASYNTHFGYIFGALTSDENSQYVPNSLTNVELIGGTVIKEKAFLGCSSLISITIPTTLKVVEGQWLNQCNAIVDVYFSGTIEDWCNITFEDEYANPMVYAKRIYFLEENQYQELTRIEVPSSIIRIGKYQFHHFNRLTEIVLPSSIQAIGISAFGDCNQLEKVYYQGSVEDWCNISIVTNNANPMYYASLFYLYNESHTYDILNCFEIPETVTSIGANQFYGFSQLTEIVLPATITNISWNAFAHCSSLIKINMPNGITEISSSTFEECNALKDIVIPEGVTRIGQKAFKGCGTLESIVVPHTVIQIESAAFQGCSSLSSITLPFVGEDSDTTSYNWGKHFGYIFGANSYTNNSDYVPASLQEVIITGGTQIVEQAFYGCSSLTRVVIPETVTNIGLGALGVCNNLTQITLPFIGESVDGNKSTLFGHIFGAKVSTDRLVPTSLKEVIITGGTRVYDMAFIHSSSIERIVLPETIESIGVSAFSGCTNLTTLVLHHPITTIEKNAFYQCSHLENIYYQGTIEAWCYIDFATADANPMYYGKHFYYSEANDDYQELIELEIPETITTIGSYQFSGFSNLTSIVIPDTVTTINASAFIGCSHLEKMTLPFVGCTTKNKNETWQYPLGILFGKKEYNGGIGVEQTYYGDSLTKTRTETFYIPATLQQVTITGGQILYGAFSNCTTLVEVTLLDEISEIGTTAFLGCSHLTRLSMGEHMSVIGESAFKDCTNLRDMVIPDSVTVINAGSFSNCTELNAITLPAGLISVGLSAFSNCTQLKSVYYRGTVGDWCHIQFSNNLSNPMYYATDFYVLDQDAIYQELTTITIPNDITAIGNYQFVGFSKVTQIVLPDSITKIGTSAFYNCTKLVEVINLSQLSIVKGSTSNGYVGYYAIHIYTEEGEEHFITTENGLIFYHDNGNYYLIGYTGTETDLILPESIQGQSYAIYARAFYNCRMLNSIEIPHGVTAIGDSAFEDCTYLTNLTISSDVTTISEYAFYYCNLTTVTYQGTIEEWGDVSNQRQIFSTEVIIQCTDGEITYDF
ncbi:MAG: leucine-rich repeat protein [Prevotella sp.]|nr:leucine-rich repeat protein [Prevotella sp.]